MFGGSQFIRINLVFRMKMNTSYLRYAAKGTLLKLPYALTDSWQNRRWSSKGRGFVIARHSGKAPYFHDYFFRWLGEAVPQVRALFQLRLLPVRRLDWSRVAAFSAWLQDPAVDWLPPNALARVRQIEGECDLRRVPVINSIDKHTNATKSVGAGIIASLGIRTPKIESLEDATRRDELAERSFPLILRDDRGHGRPSFHVTNADQLASVEWDRLRNPIVAEFIDVRSPKDGLYRKYRYLAAGDVGVPRHLIISRDWEVRAKQRIRNAATQREELDYLREPDPNHDQLQAIRHAMGLDLVAFDYSYDPQGRLVVWEANPYPDLSFPAGGAVEYTRPFVERSYAAMAAMYLRAAGFDVPATIRRRLGNCYPEPPRERPARNRSMIPRMPAAA